MFTKRYAKARLGQHRVRTYNSSTCKTKARALSSSSACTTQHETHPQTNTSKLGGGCALGKMPCHTIRKNQGEKFPVFTGQEATEKQRQRKCQRQDAQGPGPARSLLGEDRTGNRKETDEEAYPVRQEEFWALQERGFKE